MHKRERKPSRKFEEARADGLWPKSARRPRLCTVVDRLDNANQAIIHQQAQNEEATRQLQDMSDTVYSLQKKLDELRSENNKRLSRARKMWKYRASRTCHADLQQKLLLAQAETKEAQAANTRTERSVRQMKNKYDQRIRGLQVTKSHYIVMKC